EWNGANWSQRMIAGPTRTLHAMAFDSQRGVAVMFGGSSGNGVLRADTWELEVTCSPLLADLDCDCDVDLADLTTLLAHFGTPAGASHADGDLDVDGSVSLADLTMLLGTFGATCQ